jgi:gliding motility-associated-like protein
LINTYHWNFGDPGSGTNDSSDLSNPTHVFSDTGVYTIKLIVNRGEQCTDTGFTVLKVYPGFFPGFTSTGTCINFPIQFNDTTNTVYGVVNTWSWNFGDLTTVADTSHNQNPSWLFATPGPKDVSLIVTNSKGCKDTATVVVQVLDKPPISVAPADTLICRNDAVQLHATGTGVFSWTPPVNIINANTPDPTVSPTSSTWYYVTLNENGCINRDSAHVRVISTVTVVANNDTTICRGDPAFLGANTDGLQYLWSPAATLDNPTLLNPTATPLVTTTYVLRSTVGGCSNIDSMTVKVVPYPGSNAGPNQIICYNGTAQLNGGIVGSSFTWIPASYLNNPNILNPLSTPPRTTDYILTVFDTLGCPKPGRDTITVTVLPKIRPFAGRDTIVIVGQPLQFNGSGGTSYQWIPSTGLSNPTIPNPIGTYGAEIDSIRYTLIVSDAAGCSDSAFVKVRVFKTAAYVFVPTAFTPNNDGLNDVIRPIAVGIQKINYFSIYNRWGQLVFTTTTNGHGWDGNIRGTPQGTSTFVWMVSAIDYKGAPIFLKGHTTLIR